MEAGGQTFVDGHIQAMAPEYASDALALSERLGASWHGDSEFVLQLGVAGLQLQSTALNAPGPLRVDFVGGAMAHRRLHGGGAGQMIAKAMGLQPGVRPPILDATAGLGRDAFVLAQLGCRVSLIERHQVIAALLADGIRRALLDPVVGPIVARMELRQGNAISLMASWEGAAPQVIYLDPMFPHREKSSSVKKEMSLLRPLVGDDDDAPALLDAALFLASHRVVVKRPRKAPSILGHKVGYTLEGKSSRFDIYPKKTLKASQHEKCDV